MGLGNELSFSPLSIPHIVLACVTLAVIAHAVLIRGNPVMRVGLLAVGLAGLPYSACIALMLSSQDPELSRALGVTFVGAIALLGPPLMMIILAMAGRLEPYRWLVGLAYVTASIMAVITWTTDWVIEAEPWQTSLGYYYLKSKPLDALTVGQFPFWVVLGLWLARRGGPAPETQRRSRLRNRIAVLVIVGVGGMTDALLGQGIGFYPFGVIPGTAAYLGLLVAVRRHDFLHARGFDRASAIETGLMVAAGLMVWLLLTSADPTEVARSPWLVVGLSAPALLLAQASMLLVRRQFDGSGEPGARTVDAALESYVELTSRCAHEHEIEAPLRELLARSGGLPEAEILILGGDGRLRPVGADDESGVPVDARIRPWLVAHGRPVVLDDLPTMRLGGLRQPVERFMEQLGAAVAAPLVDRGNLVGFISGHPPGDRALREEESSVLVQAAGATARALTYASLLREAEGRVEVAREVEIASAVQEARTAGEQEMWFGDCQVAVYYEPATHFGGHWWSSCELADERFAIVLGDVTGSGVPAALVSFTAEGASETAERMFGTSLEVISLLETLDAAVRHVGGARHAMSCFAAIFDPPARTVTFANAGYPFPYLCRRGRLQPLVSRGTLLGDERLVLSARTLDLEVGDTVVFCSDSVSATRSPEGRSYGERRLQRIIEGRAAASSAALARAIVEDLAAFAGDTDLADDLNLVVVRVGVPRE